MDIVTALRLVRDQFREDAKGQTVPTFIEVMDSAANEIVALRERLKSEREACAKIADSEVRYGETCPAAMVATRIRNRS